MGAVLEFKVALESTTCAGCGVEFAMPSHLLKSRRVDKKDMYCPNGHVLSYRESENDRLKRELEAAKATAQRESERAARNWKEKEAADRRARAARGQVTRMKKRTAHGVCPVDGCKRCFAKETALQRHLKTKHPDFVAPEPSP